MRAVVLFGANIDPRVNLARAIAELRSRFRVVAVSPAFLTAPIGDTEQPDFVNAAVALECDAGVEAIQAALAEIEAALGRRRDPLRPSGPRTVDLDLILVGDAVGRFGKVELPAPLLEREAFVAVPVAALDPTARHPVSGERLGELAARLAARGAAPRRLEESDEH